MDNGEKTFALIGAAGYIAPRHMESVANTGNQIVAALDPNDSVGIIDSYFPSARFFTEFERFDRHIDMLRRKQEPIDYLSVCSPNYLHDSHARFGLRSGADVICEKPIVLNPWNIDGLQEMERETGKRVFTILQLRHHESVLALKEKVQANASTKYDVDLTYITSRGRWYHTSWKGDESKSGGIATNIGVHFYDMLHFVFGDLQHSELHYRDHKTSCGYLEYQHARVRWCLSIDAQNLPDSAIQAGQRTFRNISIGENEFEFSGGFTDLHTKSYAAILNGDGYGLEDNRVAIETVANLRNLPITTNSSCAHPLLSKLTDD